MCDTAPRFSIEFNRRLNLHLCRTRRNWKHFPQALSHTPRVPDGFTEVYFSGLHQKSTPDGPWGMPGLEYLTDNQRDLMDRLICYLEEAEMPSHFGQEEDGRFFIAIPGCTTDILMLKLST